jgi:hypothetical protein
MIITKDQVKDRGCEGGEFGWGDFIASSPDTKALYMGATLMSNLVSMGYQHDIAAAVASEWAGVKVPENSYIDHQSALVIPSIREPYMHPSDYLSVNHSFFDDLRKFVGRDGVVVVGGNDNDDEPAPKPVGDRIHIGVPKDDRPDDFVARKDGEHWVMFNRITGGKIRFSFTTEEPYTKATWPELVDIKITDYCQYGCGYCYTNSGCKGKHADKDFLQGLAWALSGMGVMEVALGGGDPTSHPDLNEIIDVFNSAAISVNITTRKDELKKLVPSFNNLSAVAVSVGYPYEVVDSHDWQVRNGGAVEGYKWRSHPKMYANLVMGTISRAEFEELIHACGLVDVTPVLLGFKHVGRGLTYKPLKGYSWWLTEAVRGGCHIDTALAREYANELKQAGADYRSYYTQEGAFSMYVDAVSGAVGPSSYELDKMVSVDWAHVRGVDAMRDKLTAMFNKF